MKKRIASILLVLVMALSLIPTTVWAWTSTVSTYEALKSRISSRSYNNPIEIRVVTFLTNTSCAFLAILVARFTDRIEVSFVSFAIFPARYAI